MAKKAIKIQSGDSGFWDAMKQGISIVTDIGLNSIVGNLRGAATDFMKEVQGRAEHTIARFLKAVTIFAIIIFGLILAVVGLGTFLSETVPALNNGLGFVLVGAILVVLGLIIQFFRK